MKYKWLLIIILWGMGWGLSGCGGGEIKNKNTELGIIVNKSDPLSVKIAKYYQKKRKIPDKYLIEVNFDPNKTTLSMEEFERIKTEVDRLTPPDVQGYGLTWAKPYRVDCMSITSAFAMGFDQHHCAKGCVATQANPYFNSKSSRPYSDFGIRPTMAIAARSFEEAKALIDRGVASDNSHPQGTAYLMNTEDKARNVRSAFYPMIMEKLASKIPIKIIKGEILKDKKDILFYFTGVAKVKELETNTFLPGGLGDHLTSFGGKLTDSGQMSSLEWLKAGATGSYGTVVEPCNFPQKFPQPGVVMYHYLQGDNLLNAYWKSVAWVGQGIFIGEPLARPFGKSNHE